MRLVVLIALLLPISVLSQIDSAFIGKIKALDTANVLKSDTVAVPDDALTKKIKALLTERRGLTIEAIVKLKITEERQKDTSHSKQFYNSLMEDVTSGRTATLLNNSLINLYRRTFTEKEIDDLLIFYSTSLGKKMDEEFLLLLVESAKDAEQLLKMSMKRLDQADKK